MGASTPMFDRARFLLLMVLLATPGLFAEDGGDRPEGSGPNLRVTVDVREDPAKDRWHVSYLFSRPVPAPQAELLIHEWQSEPT